MYYHIDTITYGMTFGKPAGGIGGTSWQPASRAIQFHTSNLVGPFDRQKHYLYISPHHNVAEEMHILDYTETKKPGGERKE